MPSTWLEPSQCELFLLKFHQIQSVLGESHYCGLSHNFKQFHVGNQTNQAPYIFLILESVPEISKQSQSFHLLISLSSGAKSITNENPKEERVLAQ